MFRVEGLGPLCGDDVLHFLQGPARVENIAGDGKAVATAHIRVEFEHAAGEAQGLLAQVIGRVGPILQDPHHVAGLQHRADTVAYRLATIGDHHIQRQPHALGDEFKQASQALGLRHGTHLGGGSDGDVQHQVGGTGGDFLRQDGGHHLPR